MLSVVNNLSILLKSDVSGRISLLVNAQVLEKCVHLPMSQYDNETTYNRIRFTSEQTSIRCTNLINTFFLIVQCLISFASVVCVLVSFNGIIVIASVVASIPLFFVNKYVSSFWYKISVGRVEKQRYSDVLRDLMLRNDNIKELKLFGSLSYLKSRILNQQTDFFREDQMNRKKFCKIDTAQKAANDFVILLLKLWIIILGIKQRATLGTINLYTSSLDQIQSAIFSFCTQLNTFYEQALYLESLFDLFDMQTEDENCGTPLTEPIRTIEFRHVYFSYPATNVYALKNVSFVLDDRHTYALIGLNGSGKTTLLKLLMKLYKPTLGTILINGQDIEEIDTAGLRKRISAIFQDFIKYPFTAEENITISDLENANDLHRLSKVIDDAGAAEVIDGLPHRLQTQLQKGWNGGTEYAREIAEKQAQRELLQQEESPDEEIISRIEAELTQLTAEETQNREALAEAEARLNEADAALESVQSQREEAARTAAQAAEQAEQARNDARHAYEKSVEAASETAAANAASATVLAEQIREMESSVETLKKLDEQEGVFCAPQTGTVESLQLMQGQTSGQVGGSISDPERGYQIRFALEAEDAVQDTAGVTVTVMQGAKSESVKINSSVSQQDGGVVLSAALTGSDWQVGKAELTIRLSETEYDCCLPVSALHSDNGGDFVYSVEERNTILGLQNIVRKVYVEVVERNNELAALRNYTTGAPVVAATTKSLQEGARVRTAG